ncbi:hypothetical protein [Noviherbaspirillum sp. ST9]|uniref:hypothetical protein n=1 Tax=Noviherbaspirillum sp. ST9 TaxID=3401606 RepID=UPI003B5889C6
MPTLSFQGCTDTPSYFSEKCSECSFACLKGGSKQMHDDADTTRGTLSIPGIAAVAAGAVASIAGYSDVSAALTVMGAASIVIRIVRK